MWALGAAEPPPPVGESDAPLQTVVHASVGVVNPYNVLRETPFVQSVAVPLAVNVPQGVYGVRIGTRQLAAQARTVKHRPNGNARLLRVEGVWPADLTSSQYTISLTALPPDVTPEVTVTLAGDGTLQLRRNGTMTHALSAYAATAVLSGNKLTQLKGSNSSPSYVPSISFHEWHVPRVGSQTSVGAIFRDLVVEEDTSLLRVYLARGSGQANSMYEFQMRLIVFKYRPWVKWEYTTYKHMPVNAPGASSGTTMAAISSERLIVSPVSPFTEATIKETTGSSVAVRATAFGVISGISGTYTDKTLNAARMLGPDPISVGIADLMARGPSGLVATTTSLTMDLWSQHTTEVLDFRGTGGAGEVQASTADYPASPRGTGMTWEGLFVLGGALPLVQQFVARDDLWFMTAQALEDSEAFGPLKAAAGTEMAGFFKRVKALERAFELAAERNLHIGYVQYGLTPSVIPNSVDTSLDRYVARQPMHSGRYGQSKDGTGVAGAGLLGILTNDRRYTLNALQSGLMKCDINGHHRMLFGVDYMGNSRDGTHRRYRDPWTGKSNDTQYMYPEGQYTAYWLGGARRHVERASRVTDRLYTTSTSGYAHSVWGWAVRYEHTHDPADLVKLNAMVAETISDSNAESDFPQPSGLNGKISSVMWQNFRYGHNTCAMIEALYEATGNSQYLDDMALALRTYMSWPTGARARFTSPNEVIAMYGSFTSFFHIVAYLKLRGYSSSLVPNAALTSMAYWVGNDMLDGYFRYNKLPLPSGDVADYTWEEDVLDYFNSNSDEGAGFEERYSLLIASYYAS